MDFKEIKRYTKSLVFGKLKSAEWKKIETFCMFIGYQRSGHSFIGALLDAHPNAVMGMEVDALNLVRLGYSKNQLFYCLIRNSEVFTKKLNNRWTGYSYAVPGQYQGTFTSLRMIGDKKGGKSTLRLGEDSNLFEKLKQLVGCRIKVLHVIRHPMDNISTMILRHFPEERELERYDYLDKIDLFFAKARINQELISAGTLDVFSLYHEDFISDPELWLKNILNFVGLPLYQDYIESCSAIVNSQPHISRNRLEWPVDLVEEVNRRAMEFSFLRRYYTS